VTATILTAISEQPLDVSAHEAGAAHPRAGASVVFCGVVREHDHGREVVALEYLGHPSAPEVLADVVREYADLPDVLGIAVSHRVGELAIGDVALVAVISTAHRGQAFELCAQLVDDVKCRLPIWKRQVFADGSDEWVNCP
jgi:molybdopterin synthase catalytic subunit